MHVIEVFIYVLIALFPILFQYFCHESAIFFGYDMWEF